MNGFSDGLIASGLGSPGNTCAALSILLAVLGGCVVNCHRNN